MRMKLVFLRDGCLVEKKEGGMLDGVRFENDIIKGVL